MQLDKLNSLEIINRYVRGRNLTKEEGDQIIGKIYDEDHLFYADGADETIRVIEARTKWSGK